MVQLGGIPFFLALLRAARCVWEIAKNLDHAKSEKIIPKLNLDVGYNFLNKEISSDVGSGLTLTNSEIIYYKSNQVFTK